MLSVCVCVCSFPKLLQQASLTANHFTKTSDPPKSPASSAKKPYISVPSLAANHFPDQSDPPKSPESSAEEPCISAPSLAGDHSKMTFGPQRSPSFSAEEPCISAPSLAANYFPNTSDPSNSPASSAEEPYNYAPSPATNHFTDTSHLTDTSICTAADTRAAGLKKYTATRRGGEDEVEEGGEGGCRQQPRLELAREIEEVLVLFCALPAMEVLGSALQTFALLNEVYARFDEEVHQAAFFKYVSFDLR